MSSPFPSLFISAKEARLHKLQPPEEEEDWRFSGLYLPSRNGKLAGVEWYNPSALANFQCFSNFQLLLDSGRLDHRSTDLPSTVSRTVIGLLVFSTRMDSTAVTSPRLEDFCSFIWMLFVYKPFFCHADVMIHRHIYNSESSVLKTLHKKSVK